MTILRPQAEEKLNKFLREEWPYSWSYFSQLSARNSGWLDRFMRKRGVNVDTIDLGILFIEKYRADPEGTMRKARKFLSVYAARRNAAKPSRQNKQAKRARAA